MIKTSDSLEYLKTLEDYSQDIIYCDPPYALGSEVIIRKDGKVDYAKANDFMNKWEMPTGAYWEKWFNEAYRVLKHGGWLIMFGMDRQLLLFKYYAHLSEFEEQQSLYWYFISNFPKATDLSKMIDKNLGEERERIIIQKVGNDDNDIYGKFKGEIDSNNAISGLAKKYEGYKYSISPLKQTNETIMVFKKPTKTGSVLHDTLAYENGDKTITVGALDIDGNRVGTNDNLTRNMSGTNQSSTYTMNKEPMILYGHEDGRYPAQTFIDSQVAELLDKQSGISKSSPFGNPTVGFHNCLSGKIDNRTDEGSGYTDIGGCSRILQKCDFNDEDLALVDIYKSFMYNKSKLNNLEEIVCKMKSRLGDIFTKEMVDGLENGELKEVEKFIANQSKDGFGKDIMEKCQKDIAFIIKTEIKQIIELKILNCLQIKNIENIIQELEAHSKLLMEFNIKNVQSVESIKKWINSISKLLTELNRIVKNVNLKKETIGQVKIEKEETNFKENITKEQKNNKCDYTTEDYDLYFYEPKVSSSERNAGCDEFDEKMSANLPMRSSEIDSDNIANDGSKTHRQTATRNNHPTLKPIDLNYRILSLFKTPNNQVICYAFAGAGSEIIGGIKAGFENWHGCEINQDYVDIANARIKYWQETMTTQVSLFDL